MIRTATRRARYTLRKPTCTQCRSLSTSYYANGTLPSSTPPNKYPTRGGQNLTDRFRRLEKSIRGKGAYEQEIVELVGDRQENEPDGSRVRPAKRDVKTFMGFAIPEEPKPPGPDECCMSGCAVCVQDLYAEALDEYNKAAESLRSSLASLNIPEDRWPQTIRTSASPQAQPKKNVAYDAFAELERQLQQKREATSQSGAPSSSLAARGPRQQKRPTVDVGLLYEGLRWVIFSNR